MTQSLLPIALLYTRGSRSIDGATRFQKLMFLAQEESELNSVYAFHADNFGPYSHELTSDLEYFIQEGYIEKNTVTNSVGNEKHVFGLTNKGIKVAQSMAQKEKYKPILQQADWIKSKFNDWNIERLLKYVYKKYPQYTIESELDLQRLFDPDARSQFLEPDTDYMGPGPEEGIEMKSSPEDIFSTD